MQVWEAFSLKATACVSINARSNTGKVKQEQDSVITKTLGLLFTYTFLDFGGLKGKPVVRDNGRELIWMCPLRKFTP